MLRWQIWILIDHADDIKLDFDATDLIPIVCCDVLFDDFGGMSGIDVREEMWSVDGLVFYIDCMSITVGWLVVWRNLRWVCRQSQPSYVRFDDCQSQSEVV